MTCAATTAWQKKRPMPELWFECPPAALACLARKDKKMAEAMKIIGHIKRKAHSTPLRGLLHAIVGQQISGKAQDSIWARFESAFPGVDAAAIASAPLESIKACGVSQRKASYMKNVAGLFATGALSHESLKAMTDEDLRQCLVQLKGIGPWTAEMLLIFTFQRHNILSYGDLAIQRGLRMLYRHKNISPQLFNRYYKRYSPWATTASFYLWEIAGGKYPQWTDPVVKKTQSPASI